MGKMTIKPWTPLTTQHYKALLSFAFDWYEEIAKEHEVTPDIMEVVFIKYARVSSRVSGVNGDYDFQLATGLDTSEETRKKFEQYLITTDGDVIDDFLEKLREMDTPHDPDLAPDLETDDPE